MTLDLKGSLFYSPEQVATIFGKDTRWIYRHSSGTGFLAPLARRFGKSLLFPRSAIDHLTQAPTP